MKYYLVYFSAFFFIACNSSIEVKNSRKKIIEYSKNGYSVVLNDSLIKINQVILDESKIQAITIDKWHKLIKIKRKNNDLNVLPIWWYVKSSENDKLLIIDNLPIDSGKLDSIEMEMDAFKSVQVFKDTSFYNRKYKEVILVTTTNNDR